MSKNRIGGCIILIFSIGYGLLAWQLPSSPGLSAGGFSPRTFPLILASTCVVLSLLLITWPVRRHDNAAQTQPLSRTLSQLNWRPAIFLCGMMCIYAAAFPYFGFIASTIIFLAGAMAALGVRRPVTLFFGSVPITVIFWLVLNKGLGIYLAPGQIFQ